MPGLISGVQILAVLGALAGVGWFASDYSSAKSENEALRAAQKANGTVLMTLGMQMKASRARAAHFQNLHEDLRHVEDDNGCSSPAVNFAYEQLRKGFAAE